jgi:periplasmic protein TonB
MYRQNLDKRDRGGAAIAVVAIHALLLFAVLNASDRIDLADPQSIMDVFDIREVEPVPEPQPEPVVPEQREELAEPEEGEASPPDIRSEATPIVAPRPEFSLPIPVPMATTQTPGDGTDATQGAAEVAGPGTGAGGAGTGTGAGGAGAGTGAGGGGVASGPSLIRGITNRDYPPEIQRRWPRGGQIFTRLWVEPNGRATRCDVMRSYGDSVADQWTCRLIMDRGQFNPARDAQGRPVASWYGYIQAETRRR